LEWSELPELLVRACANAETLFGCDTLIAERQAVAMNSSFTSRPDFFIRQRVAGIPSPHTRSKPESRFHI
jgi:hypothetical protein